MVKPGENSLPQNGITMNSGQAGTGPMSTGSATESGDFASFVVLDRSPQDSHPSSGTFANGLQSMNGGSQSFNVSSIMNTSGILSTMHELSAEEVQKKLQDVLRENVELKETLQQNNLAMKQQFNTLVTWQEDVVRVHQNHKEKFEETRSLITKLKTENANLKLTLEDMPDIEKLKTENDKLKQKIEGLEKAVELQDKVNQENSGLKVQLAQLEQHMRSSMTASEAQQRAERRVCELSEERVQLLRDNDELKQRISLLNKELTNAQVAGGFVVIEHEQPEASGIQVCATRQECAASSESGLSKFYEALDRYEERLMASYKRLDEQVDRFSFLYNWLQETSDKLPSKSPALDMAALQTLLEGLMLRLREAQAGSTDHRLRLEEAGQQLGRLSSDFQGLIQEWLQFNKQNKDTQQHGGSYHDLASLGYKEQVDHLTAQLLSTKEKLAKCEADLTEKNSSLMQYRQQQHQSNASSLTEIQAYKEQVGNLTTQLLVVKEKLEHAETALAEHDAALENSALEKYKVSNTSLQQVQGYKDHIDHLTAQLLELQEKFEQSEKKLGQRANDLADRDALLAQHNVRLSQQDAKLTQKETELRLSEKKIQGLEQKVDALAAQAEVYKMDFNEERESREKIAADKERVVDDLRALQRRNQQLLEQLETCQQQLVQAQQHSSASGSSSSGARPPTQSYNTIATPGRARTRWPPESSDAQPEQEPAPPQYECPKCHMAFTRLQPLQNHVEICLEMDMFP